MSEMLQPWEEIKINESEPEHFHEKKILFSFQRGKKGFSLKITKITVIFISLSEITMYVRII